MRCLVSGSQSDQSLYKLVYWFLKDFKEAANTYGQEVFIKRSWFVLVRVFYEYVSWVQGGFF